MDTGLRRYDGGVWLGTVFYEHRLCLGRGLSSPLARGGAQGRVSVPDGLLCSQ